MMFRYFEIFGSKIGMFPLCVGIGLFLYVMLILYTLKKQGVDEQKENTILCPLPFALIFGVFIAYLSDVINHWTRTSFLKNPLSFGITYYGFLLGMVAFVIFYTKIRKSDTFYFLNIWIPPLAVAQACGRIGCFFAGCCYGIPFTSFFSVVYPKNSIPYQHYGSTCLFPVQLLDSFYLFVILFLIFRIKFNKRFAWYLIFIGIGRFFIEFYRGDDRGQIMNCPFLSPAQIISIAVFIGGVILLLVRKTTKEALSNG